MANTNFLKYACRMKTPISYKDIEKFYKLQSNSLIINYLYQFWRSSKIFITYLQFRKMRDNVIDEKKW